MVTGEEQLHHHRLGGGGRNGAWLLINYLVYWTSSAPCIMGTLVEATGAGWPQT